MSITAASPRVLAPLPDWEPHEKPFLPGSPAALSHAWPVRIAYALVAILVGLTGGLGSSLITANLPVIQGQLGLTPAEGAWLPAAYVMVNVTANLLVFKFRQQFGMRLFAELALGLYAALALLHLVVDGYAMAIAVRAASGFVGAAASTLAVLYMLQALPRVRVGSAFVIGMGLTQLATPLAWMISPALLDQADWRVLYAFEGGMALCAFAAVVSLKLPVGIRIHVLEKADFLTFALVAPGVALLGAVLAQGLNGWWTDTPWLAWALVGAIVLLALGAMHEYRRERPLLQIRWLLNGSTLAFVFGALMMRFLLAEQSYGAVGLLRTLGMGPDQLQPLFGVMLLGMLCGMAVSAFTFGPKAVPLQLLASVVLIAIVGFMDHHSTSLSRPHDFYASQFLLSFAAAMFLGPLMLSGVMQALQHGADHMVSFIVLFSVTQALGGLAGPSVLGTLQAQRTTVHAQAIAAHLDPTDAAVAQRLALQQRVYGAQLADPVQRAAQGQAQLGQVVRREAAVRAFNDVFTLLGGLAIAYLAWMLWRAARMRRAARRQAAAAPPSSSSSSAAVPPPARAGT
ncbi:MFS transporter [Xenophilus arseniciresistens]|uniref:MFS transporter n=1 Tax=Xenophilus arseniciresistens TaxID=1283306 RepID=A0AAE3T0I7_9BURK|nr:MFS transporter [Xenophilus arseniciresistens]MDA7417650.1 MFS transporter [Xenophilus arseniciresistens]